MALVRFGRWTVQCDPEKTRQAYLSQTGCAERCGCTICKNFIAARGKIYSAEVRALFGQLGVDPVRELEVVHTHRISRGRHAYSGWFHFFGSIESGRDAQVPRGDLFTLELEAAGAACALGFSAKTARSPAAFAGGTIVQVDFAAIVPWLLAIDEPS